MPASRARAREQRTGERVGLDVDHHDVLAVLAAREHVADARGRDPVASMTISMSGAAIKARASERKLSDEMAPSGHPTLCSDWRARDAIEIGNRGDAHAGRVTHLR